MAFSAVNDACNGLAGYNCTSDAVDDVQLKQLLEERQAAYIAVAMAAHRWAAAWQLYEKHEDLRENHVCPSNADQRCFCW